MDLGDLVLVSVDDHVVEPPDLFEGRLPAKYADLAPQFITRADGTNAWLYEGPRSPTSRSTPSPAARRRSTASSRPPSTSCAPGCYDIDERVKDMDANGVLGSLCFPSFPQFCGQLFARTEDKDVALGDGAGLQRLAHRRVVRHPPRPVHPVLAPGDLGPARCWPPRSAAPRAKGAHAVTFSENPSQARAGRASTPTTGIRSGRRAATRASSCACTSARRRSWSSPRPTRRSTC